MKNSKLKYHQKKSTVQSNNHQEHPRFFHQNGNGLAVAEEFHDEVPMEDFSNPSNWSHEQDRSEDLAEGRDPIQQPEQTIDIPNELISERAYQLYEQRGRIPSGDVSDWFEAERQLRQEIGPR